jgi:predicted nucleotidyltransferase
MGVSRRPCKVRESSLMILDMGIDNELKAEIVRRILTVARPDRIILFGSAATGQMNGDSDIDLLVLESEPGNTREESVKIRDGMKLR